MKKRFRQIITICLAMAMLISGLHFDSLKVTSYFAESNFPKNSGVIREADPLTVVAHLREGKEEYRSVSNVVERKNEKENRTDLRGNLFCFPAIALFITLLAVFLKEYQILGNALSFIFIIVSYIHEQDGEKAEIA